MEMFVSCLAQLLLGKKGEAKSTKPRLCFGREGGISPSTLGSVDGGVGNKICRLGHRKTTLYS